MHNLALALHHLGNIVTGSDDEIKEPSRSRLKAAGLLPQKNGWFPEKLLSMPDVVILGMHARSDNPELLKAQEMGLKIYSFPEYFYEHSKNKQRVVIGGSHGKTTITSMIMHVLKACNKSFDYMVGSTVEGFDTMVKLSDDAPVIILEGDEYLSSPIDRRPKFHLYKANIALLSGIAWDHINVFPTFDNYVEQFRIFADGIPEGGSLVYFDGDDELNKIANNISEGISKFPYNTPLYAIRKGQTVITIDGKEFKLEIFGKHNLANLEGARKICELLGINTDQFYHAAKSFKGAGRRLELIDMQTDKRIYRDFAHSPSKLKATVGAVKEQFPDYKLVACMELHTFSSLNENFLDEYAGSMDAADLPVVFYSPETISHKKLPPLSPERVRGAFGKDHLMVFTSKKELEIFIRENYLPETVLLMMSSGTFEGLDIRNLVNHS